MKKPQGMKQLCSHSRSQLAIFEGFKAFLLDSNSFDVSAVDGLALEALLGAIGGGFGALVWD